MELTTLLKAAVAVGVGATAGYFIRQLLAQQRRETLELKAKQILLDAKESSQKTLEESKIRAEKILAEAKEEQKEREKEQRKIEERLAHKDELLEKRSSELDKEASTAQEKLEKLTIV